MAATIWKRAGNVTEWRTRAILIRPDSIGCRRVSRTRRPNSGSSSRKRTPRVGQADLSGARRVPASNEASGRDRVGGARKGRVVFTGSPASRSPATEWTRVTSKDSRSERGGRSPGRRRASIVFPAPGRPDMRRAVAPRGGNDQSPLRQGLSSHLAQVRAGSVGANRSRRGSGGGARPRAEGGQRARPGRRLRRSPRRAPPTPRERSRAVRRAASALPQSSSWPGLWHPGSGAPIRPSPVRLRRRSLPATRSGSVQKPPRDRRPRASRSRTRTWAGPPEPS